MTTMELRACTRSCTAASNAQKAFATAVAVPVTSSVSHGKKNVNPMLAACDRIILTRRNLIARQPVQQQFLVEPSSPVKRRRRKTKAKRVSLADLNNDQQRITSASPATGKENVETVAPLGGATDAALPATPSKAKQPHSRQLLITSFVKFRRSSRQTTATLKKQREKEIEMKLIDNVEDGLVKEWLGEKGYGVIAGRRFEKDEFVCEYAGELLPSLESACERDCHYAMKPDVGCYMYYFKYLNTALCVDATRDNGRFGRLINHSRRHANVKTQVMEINSIPRLYFVTLRSIEKGEELVYDYGERRPEVLEKFPWLRE